VSCGLFSPLNAFSCVLPPQPFVLMTLTLPAPTSAGTATWLGTGPQPICTGDSFTLTVPFTRPLTPAFAGDASNPGGIPCSNGSRATICDFNISWSETAGDLTSVSIIIDAVNDNIGGFARLGAFGRTGGPLASDGRLGGCSFTQCAAAGFWQSDLTAVPEPISAILLKQGMSLLRVASPIPLAPRAVSASVGRGGLNPASVGRPPGRRPA
jgi:hypothetical protein